jgi:hypothetical protein
MVTVRAADGDTVAFDARRSELGCLPDGTVYWEARTTGASRPPFSARAPFRYEAELVLDGSRYFAEAAWPADENAGTEPSVGLEFTPTLPRLG